MIHFTNGDCVRETLRHAGLPGDIVICADPLHDGPCREGLTAAEFDRVRAQYLADGDERSRNQIEDAFAQRDRAIARAAAEDEVVLWFEHDLFDQLNLLWLFDRLRTHAVPMGLAAFAGGASTWQMAFHVQAAQEPAVFLGDLSFLRAMRTLARGDVPLVADLDEAPKVTAAGRAAIEGAADHAALNGLDRWVGGVHCTGRDPRWRCDSARGGVVNGRDARA